MWERLGRVPGSSALMTHAASSAPRRPELHGWDAHKRAFWGRARVAVSSSTGLFLKADFCILRGMPKLLEKYSNYKEIQLFCFHLFIHVWL